MNNKQKTFSLVLLFGFLFFALPLHAEELTKQQSKEISDLYDDAQRLVGEEDYQGASKTIDQALDKLEQWQSDKIHLLDFISLQIVLLTLDANFDAARNKQKEALSLTQDIYGDEAPETLDAQVELNDFEKIAALTREQQKELSEGDAAYRAAVAEGDLEKAIKLGEQMASKEKEYVGEFSRYYLNSLGLLAMNYYQLGMFGESLNLTQNQLRLTRALLGLQHPEVATCLHNQGVLFSSMGYYEKSEECYQKALHYREKVFGPNAQTTLDTVGVLANLYSRTERYEEAIQLKKRVVIGLGKVLGPFHISTIMEKADLAQMYINIGDYEKGIIELTKLKNIIESHCPNEKYYYSIVINNLAQAYVDNKDYPQAMHLNNQAVAIDKELFGPDSPRTVATLVNAGNLQAIVEKYETAISFYLQAKKILDDSSLNHTNDYLKLLNNLGYSYAAMGDFAKALDMYGKGLKGISKSNANAHSLEGYILANRARVYLTLNEYLMASEDYQRAIKNTLEKLQDLSGFQSERQQTLSQKLFLGKIFQEYLGVKVHDQADCLRVFRLSLNVKGAVTARQRAVRMHMSSPELADLFHELKGITSMMSSIYSSKSIRLDLRRTRLLELSSQKEAIEGKISSKSEAYRQVIQQTTPDQIRTTLPKKSALLDFHKCQIKIDGSSKKLSGFESRLTAFVIRPEGPIELVDLCDYEDFQRALATWKEHLGQNTGPATELGKLIWEPLAEYVDDSELVLHSPIGELGSLPFAALPGKEPGSYLIEDKRLVMIPQAKLLPSLLEREQSPKPTVLAIGGVDYESVAQNETEEPVQLAASRRAVRWNDEAVFTPLPETKTELDAVGKLYNQQFDLGKLQTLKGDRATEAAVKRLAPQYSHLHFATHGFFAPPEVKSAFDNPDNQLQRQLSFDDQPRVTGFHPGLLSGLALAGANDPPEEGEDGIWTAEEVATMNLSKVDLAVLSACETGLGKVAGGEGLLGLQRAFQVSGAGTTVASLWQVDDAATRALMDEFYRNLWEKKLPKIEALRQAQLKMLREYDPQKGTLRGVGGVRQFDTDGQPERLPPFYWAAWVLSGDWR